MTTVTRSRPEIPGRYLSLPTPVELIEDDGHGRAWLKLSEEWSRVILMENLWDIDGYQESGEPVLRMHFRATTGDGKRVLLYQDLLAGKWYRQFTLGNDASEHSIPVYRA